MLSIEVLIPALREELALCVDDTPDSAEFSGCKADAVLHTNWIEPKLGHGVVTLHVNVLRLLTVTRVEEKTIRTDP
jgi:hypothetical protein